MDGDTVKQTYYLGETTKLEYALEAPKAGVFVVSVYSFRINPSTGKKVYSEVPARSDDPKHSSVDGEPGKWIIIYSMPGPGGVVIDGINME